MIVFFKLTDPVEVVDSFTFNVVCDLSNGGVLVELLRLLIAQLSDILKPTLKSIDLSLELGALLLTVVELRAQLRILLKGVS